MANQAAQPVVVFDKRRFSAVGFATPKASMADAFSSPPLQQAITALADRQSLSERLAADVFGAVMRGEATPAQTAALLVGLRVKGETPEEVAGAARALRAAMGRGETNAPYLGETCGAGGGAVTTFNISTAAAFVAGGGRGAGGKDGNRALSSTGGAGGGGRSA